VWPAAASLRRLPKLEGFYYLCNQPTSIPFLKIYSSMAAGTSSRVASGPGLTSASKAKNLARQRLKGRRFPSRGRVLSRIAQHGERDVCAADRDQVNDLLIAENLARFFK